MHTFLRVDEDIVLSPLKMEDASDVFEIIDKDRAYLETWLPFVPLTHEQKDTEGFIERAVNNRNNEVEFDFTIRYKSTIVGLIGLKILDEVNKKSEIGYWLAEDFQHKGIVTKSVNTLSMFAFYERGVNRLQIKCGVGNVPSKKIPRRLGFVLEGVERDGELLASGAYTDLEIYSLLNREF